MSGPELTTYNELADVLANLSMLLREARRARQLSVRAAARQLGMSFATVSRVESGEDCMLSNVVAILRWLGGDQVGVSRVQPPGEPQDNDHVPDEMVIL